MTIPYGHILVEPNHIVAISSKLTACANLNWQLVSDTLLQDYQDCSIKQKISNFLNEFKLYEAVRLTLETWIERESTNATFSNFLAGIGQEYRKLRATLIADWEEKHSPDHSPTKNHPVKQEVQVGPFQESDAGLPILDTELERARLNETTSDDVRYRSKTVGTNVFSMTYLQETQRQLTVPTSTNRHDLEDQLTNEETETQALNEDADFDQREKNRQRKKKSSCCKRRSTWRNSCILAVVISCIIIIAVVMYIVIANLTDAQVNEHSGRVEPVTLDHTVLDSRASDSISNLVYTTFATDPLPVWTSGSDRTSLKNLTIRGTGWVECRGFPQGNEADFSHRYTAPSSMRLQNKDPSTGLVTRDNSVAFTNDTKIIDEIFRYLELGEKEIILSKQRDIVIVAGMSGAGKSTVTQLVAGEANNLEALEGREGWYIIDKSGTISNQTIISKTFLPNLVIEKKTDTAFYDLPGFSDTRNVSVEIANSFFIKKVADHADRIKIVIVTLHSTLHSANRNAFLNLLKQLVVFIRDVEKLAPSISLMTTKLDSRSKDTKILGNYAAFFDGVYRDIPTLWTSEELSPLVPPAQKLISILSEKDERGVLNKVGAFRTPENAGILDEMPVFICTKHNMKRIIWNNTDFTAKIKEDFGYGLSPTALLLIETSLVPDIYKNSFNALLGFSRATITSVVQKIRSLPDVHAKKVKLDAVMTKLITLENEMKKHLGISTLKDFLKIAIEEYRKSFPNEISSIFLEELLKQYPYLDFIEALGKYPWNNRQNWILPFQSSSALIQDELLWIKDFLFILFDELAEDKVQVSSSFDVLKIWWASIPKITKENFSTFWNKFAITNTVKSMKDPLRVQTIAQSDSKKLDELTLLLNTALKHGSSCTGIVSVKCSGTFVKVSEAMSHVQSTTTKLTITGTHTIYMDRDVKLSDKWPNQNFEMLILSPNIWVNGKIDRFDLSGREGDGPPSKPSGSGHTKGIPGKPGRNSGNVYVIAQKIDKPLLFELSGGRGGKGQDGQNGVAGSSGSFKVFWEGNENHCAAWSDGKIQVRIYPHTCDGARNPEICYAGDNGAPVVIFGTKGGSGSRGNDGGKGGKGGLGGTSVIYDVNYSPARRTGSPGSAGSLGAGGDGGLGGNNGDNNMLTLDDFGSITGKWCKVRSQRYQAVTLRGEDGVAGNAGVNAYGIQTPPPQTFKEANFASDIQDFKVKAGLTNQFVKTPLMDFIGKIK